MSGARRPALAPPRAPRAPGAQALMAAGWLACLAILAFSLHEVPKTRGILLDFSNFYVAGQKALHGQYADLFNPQAPVAGEPPLGTMSFVSAPLSSFLYAPLALLPPKSAIFAFKLAGTLCTYAALILLYRHLAARFLRPPERPRFFAAYCLSALVFMPFWTIYWSGGQTTPLIFLLLVLALTGCSRGRVWSTAAALAAAVLIKPVLAPGLVVLFLLADARMRLALLAAGAAAALLSLALMGVEPHRLLLERVLQEAGGAQLLQYNSNMFAWIDALFTAPGGGAPPAAVKLAVAAAKLAASGWLAWLCLRLARSGAPQAAVRHFQIIAAMLIALILAPVVWAHYLALLFVPLMFVFANASRFPQAALLAAAAAVAAGFFQLLYLVRKYIALTGFDSWGEVAALSAVKSLPMLLAFAIAALCFNAFRASYAALEEPRAQ
ncbi:glycosyltransferase 87 family protein (plasmid) [Roseobacteraceae bacterium NS-SX3]